MCGCITEGLTVNVVEFRVGFKGDKRLLVSAGKPLTTEALDCGADLHVGKLAVSKPARTYLNGRNGLVQNGTGPADSIR
jgi:hypothetical protein